MAGFKAGDMVTADAYGGPIDGVVMWYSAPFYRVRVLRDRRVGEFTRSSHSFTCTLGQLTTWEGN